MLRIRKLLKRKLEKMSEKNITDIQANKQREVESVVDGLDQKNFPILCDHRRVDREWLVEQILHQAIARPTDSIGMMLACYESGLEHIAPQQYLKRM